MACADCLKDAKEQQQELNTFHMKAKQFAIDHQVNVFLYEDEYGQMAFMAEASAITIGIQPTKGILSPLQPVTA